MVRIASGGLALVSELLIIVVVMLLIRRNSPSEFWLGFPLTVNHNL